MFILWAIWRRVLGGWGHFSRPVLVVLGALLAAIPYAWFGYWTGAGVAAALTVAFWTPGHNFMSDRALWLRYGPVGISWMLCRRYWPGPNWTEAAELGAGAIFGLIYDGIFWAWILNPDTIMIWVQAMVELIR